MTCPYHPSYEGKGRPRIKIVWGDDPYTISIKRFETCPECWYLYTNRHYTTVEGVIERNLEAPKATPRAKRRQRQGSAA